MGCASCKFWSGHDGSDTADCTNPDVLSDRTPFDGWCILHSLRASPTPPQVDMQSQARGVYSTTYAPVITPTTVLVMCSYCGNVPVTAWLYTDGTLAHYRCNTCLKTWT